MTHQISPALVREGIAAADEVLSKLFGPAPATAITKAAANPLTPKGFDAVVLGLLRDLSAAATPSERKAIKAALEALDGDWPRMTVAQRALTTDRAARAYLGLTRDVAPRVGKLLRSAGPSIVTSTKAAAKRAHRLRITPSLSLPDQRVVEHAASSQAHFVTNAYGQRAAALSQTARAIVAKGLDQGLDRHDIGAELAKALPQLGRAESYFQVLASTFAARARSWSMLSGFSEAGISKFQFEAIVDEVTSPICRVLHGKTFSVRAGVERFDQVSASADPEAVKDLQPWARNASDGDTRAIFIEQGGKRRLVAKAGADGAFKSAMSEQQLEAAGLTTPPLHGHCRSTIVPA